MKAVTRTFSFVVFGAEIFQVKRSVTNDETPKAVVAGAKSALQALPKGNKKPQAKCNGSKQNGKGGQTHVH